MEAEKSLFLSIKQDITFGYLCRYIYETYVTSTDLQTQGECLENVDQLVEFWNRIDSYCDCDLGDRRFVKTRI